MSRSATDAGGTGENPIRLSKRGLNFLWSRRQPPEDVRAQAQDLPALIANANRESLNQMVSLNKERMRWAERMQRHLEHSFEAVKAMSFVTFTFGWVLIVVPFFLFYFSTPRDPNLLWFSGIGMAGTLTVLVYRPMQRVQQATSDMVQSIIILNSWVTEVGLTLYLLKTEGITTTEEIARATDLVSATTKRHVEWLEEYTEKEPTEPKGAAPGSDEGKAAATPHSIP